MPGIMVVSLTLGLGAWAQDTSEKEPAATEEAGGKEEQDKKEAEDLTEYVEVNETYVPTSNTIATKLPVPLQDTPSNIGTVSDRLLEEQFAVDLGGALENISGINVQGGSGIFETFMIRGFDSLTQTASGINHAEAEAEGKDTPRPLPCQALDHAAGYLLAFGAMAALLRRAEQGGSWHVRVSLAQTGRWIRNLGRVEGGLAAPDPGYEQVTDLLETTDCGSGRLTAVRHTAQLSQTPVRWTRPSMPLGTHAAAW